MSNFDSDAGADYDWEERGGLAWNEFDWERYLREQDDAIRRYLALYEECRDSQNRIDAVADRMDWDGDAWGDEEQADSAAGDDDLERERDFDDAGEIYTLHKNPIFISTKAIYLGLNQSWQAIAIDGTRVPQPLAVGLVISLGRGEDLAVQAIHALDFGDYAMAVSLFKRALSALNASLALINADQALRHKDALEWRQRAIPALFDLREIWLRVIAQCREETQRPRDEEA